VKYEPLMRSDSCEASSAEEEVSTAEPVTSEERSTRKGGWGTLPLVRMSVPLAQESTIATCTSAPIPSR
jgi:hypothetical protein